MSKPNLKKLQKKTLRKEKIKKQEQKSADSERISFLVWSAEDAFHRNLYDIAARYCKSILNTSPNHRIALAIYGDSLYSMGNYIESARAMERLIALYPDNPGYKFNYVIVLQINKKFKEALELGTKLIKERKLSPKLINDIKNVVEFCQLRIKSAEFDASIASKILIQNSLEKKVVESVGIQYKDLEKIRLPQIGSTVAPPNFIEHIKNNESIDPNGLFWLGYLLFGEHQRMQSEFEELLCLKYTTGITHFGYQSETVRKVLKIFHGRVLLSDEVGLGKTIEAAMVLKEYLLRGMVKSVLILCPPSLIDQWANELQNKFDIRTHKQSGSLSVARSKTFWKNDIVIASLHTAKNAANKKIVTAKNWDMVIVDEAHHVRNNKTLAWKLVNSIQKKFLLLLSATPVQNNLVELYNLITLLKPGTFPPEKEFLATYCEAKNLRKPKNADTLRLLLRDVMIRNTRAGCGVRFPKRFATTYRVEFTQDEKEIYEMITTIAHQCSTIDSPLLRISVRQLLERAGAHIPLALNPLRSLTSLLNKGKIEVDPDLLKSILNSAEQCFLKIAHLSGLTAKLKQLVTLLRESNQPVLVFCRHISTVNTVCEALLFEDIPYAAFHGSLPVQQRNEAIERFRSKDVKVLVSSESGGEGHNLQFCNTLVNFDLPWNPMQIEQRIGRIHRIGQESDVFVFNLSCKGTLESQILDILETKIRMFELVVGEVDSILGNLDEQGGFSEVILDMWIKNNDTLSRDKAFKELGDQLVNSRASYLETCALDNELFGQEIEV